MAQFDVPDLPNFFGRQGWCWFAHHDISDSQISLIFWHILDQPEGCILMQSTARTRLVIWICTTMFCAMADVHPLNCHHHLIAVVWKRLGRTGQNTRQCFGSNRSCVVLKPFDHRPINHTNHSGINGVVAMIIPAFSVVIPKV